MTQNIANTPSRVSGRKVLIGTPAQAGQVGMRYAYALAETYRLGDRLGATVNVMFRGYAADLQWLRDCLVADALEGGYSDLIFIDEDQDWKPEDIFCLLAYPVDCVGAPVRKKLDEEFYNVRASSPNLPVDFNTGLLVVDGIGTGCLRLSRAAMQAVWDRSEEYRDDSGRVLRRMFPAGVANGRLVGEDIAFCGKLREAGITIYVDPEIIVGHSGVKRWEGDFTAWLKRRQNRAA